MEEETQDCCLGDIIKDTVHGDISLPEICYKIIDTPQFQRLRFIKQIGPCNRVYPTACHTRFEHSIGVSYLAGKYGKILQSRQPSLGITSSDILCLYIAGLCHDLGHGPFSHSWHKFMQRVAPEYSHKSMCLKMFDFLIQDEANGLVPLFDKEGIDISLVKGMMIGHRLEGQGQEEGSEFLYKIVKNPDTKVDVDNFDSILRNCRQLNFETDFDAELIMNNTKVNGQDMAYSRDVLGNLKSFFEAKNRLYKSAFKRRTNNVIELMLVDALSQAQDHFKVKGQGDRVLTLVDAWTDVHAFLKLTDTVLDQIYNWDNGGEKAKQIVDDLIRRKLYTNLGFVEGGEVCQVREGLAPLGESVVLLESHRGVPTNPMNNVTFYGKHVKGEVHYFKETFYNVKVDEIYYIILRPAYTEEMSEEVLEQKILEILEKCGVEISNRK